MSEGSNLCYTDARVGCDQMAAARASVASGARTRPGVAYVALHCRAGRRTNLALLSVLGIAFAAGLLGYGVGTPAGSRIVVVAHGIAGLATPPALPGTGAFGACLDAVDVLADEAQDPTAVLSRRGLTMPCTLAPADEEASVALAKDVLPALGISAEEVAKLRVSFD
jgi:hypothetical protein